MKPTTPPLGRSVDRDVLDWDGVERRVDIPPKDVLGLRPEDRAALGMTRTGEIVPHAAGDANAALADLLQRGVAIGKTDKRRR